MKTIKKNEKRFKDQKKDLGQKLGMFDRLGDKCLTCNAEFDKKNKQQVQSWFVVVRNKEQQVNLYCPECWEAAQQVAKELNGNTENGFTK